MTERKGRGCGTRKLNKGANGVKKVGEGERKERGGGVGKARKGRREAH